MSTPQPKRVPWHSLPAASCSRNRVIKFTNCSVYLDGAFRRSDLWVRDGRVIDPAKRFWEAANFAENSCDLVVDCEGHILSPGFVDIQFNGEEEKVLFPRDPSAAHLPRNALPILPPLSNVQVPMAWTFQTQRRQRRTFWPWPPSCCRLA